ncbi:hypothetical protein QFC21_000729 [Naganishia friedmannii]|uniref:Uncharacterized protein n=1 Tax=Naganishia friedmannii TaxID=89922 RepID=A0ACC2W9K0_9TREE|nr:hypothetical protein QFC21_000729 [Naganishia friedmannii]
MYIWAAFLSVTVSISEPGSKAKFEHETPDPSVNQRARATLQISRPVSYFEEYALGAESRTDAKTYEPLLKLAISMMVTDPADPDFQLKVDPKMDLGNATYRAAVAQNAQKAKNMLKRLETPEALEIAKGLNLFKVALREVPFERSKACQAFGHIIGFGNSKVLSSVWENSDIRRIVRDHILVPISSERETTPIEDMMEGLRVDGTAGVDGVSHRDITQDDVGFVDINDIVEKCTGTTDKGSLDSKGKYTRSSRRSSYRPWQDLSLPTTFVSGRIASGIQKKRRSEGGQIRNEQQRARLLSAAIVKASEDTMDLSLSDATSAENMTLPEE